MKNTSINRFGIISMIVLAVLMLLKGFINGLDEPPHMILLFGLLALVSIIPFSGIIMLGLFLLGYAGVKINNAIYKQKADEEKAISSLTEALSMLTPAVVLGLYVYIFFFR